MPCTSLTSLSITVTSVRTDQDVLFFSAALPDQDVLVISRLSSLQQLKLIFHTGAEIVPRMNVAPLSRLMKLEQLTVEGFAAREQSSGLAVAVQLPASLTFLCCASPSREEDTLDSWESSVMAATSLRKLHLVDGELNHSRFIWGLSSLQELTELVCTYTSSEYAGYLFNHALPASVSKLSKLEVLRIETRNPIYPWHQHVFSSTSLGEILLNCPKLRVLGPAGDFNATGSTEVTAGVQMEHLRSVSVYDGWELHGWLMSARVLPALESLEVGALAIHSELVQGLCVHTQLTQLRLDTGFATAALDRVGRAGQGLKHWGALCPSSSGLSLRIPTVELRLHLATGS